MSDLTRLSDVELYRNYAILSLQHRLDDREQCSRSLQHVSVSSKRNGNKEVVTRVVSWNIGLDQRQ